MDSPDRNDNETTQTPFGRMVDSRNAHLEALPGKVFRDWFEQLNRASGVFAGNSVELEKHFTQFVGTQMFVSELPDDFGTEAARLLHNYLAALATLRDVMRGIHRRVWPECQAPGTDDKRTKWEVEVWTPKVDELLSDEPTTFLVDLRNYSLHYAIPVTSMTTNWSNTGGGGPTALWNTITVNRTELLKWGGWRSKGRKYIASHTDDNVDVMTPIATYSTRVREFFGWFWERMEDSNRIDILEYRYKSMEFGLYLQQDAMLAQFGPDGRSVLRPQLAKARLQRAEFGTRGWRLIALDQNGEWVVGDRDANWPPLPTGPR
ncbi:Uncharacterised protein [Mycobacteroides abscessus subsp. bolletii]|uniref:hypothetical protein n=1 Tax=Mycobacteroides abscessus TaxID=36809 RepID=UPI00092C6273|nr:hypothetical protein [Mycobacteroides abscessus]SHQ49441.1 Uncharacterised protein [Mycobacteroides abscessus subsp. bolletii]SHR50956.1 Uncharacterised protein [Mycobacteroides abscessus subsp. bolletii]SHS34109.1 Uncharacterised protein [Mycobacteroides abscessus subsp. bolletii]SHT02062.1 Uncharacterised protein [Mycobacteroides abscessus subsp. bolletii]SHX99453.1 Uncharacterised protein [Mycobacteroides abscessus subsp. bolletii]